MATQHHLPPLCVGPDLTSHCLWPVTRRAAQMPGGHHQGLPLRCACSQPPLSLPEWCPETPARSRPPPSPPQAWSLEPPARSRPPPSPHPRRGPWSPLPAAGLPTPPGNWCLFLARVGSVLSAAADVLYLAGFNELGWQTAAWGAFLLRVCASVLDVACVRADVCVHQCACERTGARLHTRMRVSP